MGRVRRELVEHARRAGLGKVVRLHREYRPTVALWLLVSVGAIVAAITTFILRFEDNSPIWQWPVLAWAGLLALTLLWQYGTPVPARRPGDCPPGSAEADGFLTTERRWFAVAERGLLVRAGETVAVRWSDVRVRLQRVDPLPSVSLVLSTDGVECAQELPAVSGRAALIRAVKLDGRVPSWPPLRVVGTGFLGLLTALVLWFAAVPLALHVVAGERPADLKHLARLCEGGPAFGRAASYQGPGPHPLALYSTSSYPSYTWGGQGSEHPEADTVQLVACQRPAGRASDTVLTRCRYQGGYTYETYQGRYRVDVLETRTGRQVTSFTIDGTSTTHACQPWTYVAKSKPSGLTAYESEPDRVAYEAQLGKVLADPVG